MTGLRERQYDRQLGVAVHIVAIVVVAVFLVGQASAGDITDVVLVLSMLSLVGWVASRALPASPALPRRIALTAMVATAALAAAPTNGLMVVAVVLAVIAPLTDMETPLWFGLTLGLVAAGLMPVGALTVDIAATGMLSLEAAAVVAVLGGIARRQTRERDKQARELAESVASMREEQAKASALAARQTLARDLHDVLAHSLGGLVIQLDAVDALLESGRTDEARRRAQDARLLAAAGLGEARRAVDALRESSEQPADTVDISSDLAELVEAHLTLGGDARYTVSGTPRETTATTALALSRALQESLSNARKHAPGMPVTVDVLWGDDCVRLRVSNPMPASDTIRDVETSRPPLARTGGGNGLRGMAERFTDVPGGHVEASVQDDHFVVEAEAGLT